MNLGGGCQRSVLNGPQTPTTSPRQTRDINRHFNQHLPQNAPPKRQPRKHHFDQCLQGFQGWWALLDLNQ